MSYQKPENNQEIKQHQHLYLFFSLSLYHNSYKAYNVSTYSTPVKIIRKQITQEGEDLCFGHIQTEAQETPQKSDHVPFLTNSWEWFPYDNNK